MKKLKNINIFKILNKKHKRLNSSKSDFERTEFEDTDFQQYNEETVEPNIIEENNGTKTKEIRKIKISKKKMKKAGIVAIPGIVILYCLSKFFGNNTNQEDAIYKWGQTNNIETVELKKGLEVERGTDIIQEIRGDDVTTMLLTEKGLQDITKYDKKLNDLAIEFYKNGTVSANEAIVELMSMNGEKRYKMLENTEVLIYPDYYSRQDGMYHVRDLKTGEEGFVKCLLIDKGEDIEFIPPEGEESPIHIVGTIKNRRADIRSTEYVYEGTGNENVIGHIGSYEGGMDFTVATVDENNPEFYYLLEYTNKDMYLSSSEVADLYQLTNDGIKENSRASDVLQTQDKNENIEKNHFESGVVANGVQVGKGFLSRGKYVEPGSLYFEFSGGKCTAVTSDGVVNISSTDKENVDINYVQTGTVYGYGKSVSIKDNEGKNIEGKYIVDCAQISTLPEDSIVIDYRTLIPLFDERTMTKGYLWESDIPNLNKKQIEIPSDSELFILKANEDTPIRISEQNSNGYYDNIIYTIPLGDNIIVEYKDDMYTVNDPRYPELNGGLIVDDTILLEYQITSDGIEEIEQKEEKQEKDEQGEKTSSRNDNFKKRLAIKDDNHTNEKQISSNKIGIVVKKDSEARG